MGDRVTREDMKTVAPDPGDDFKGWMAAVIKQISREIEEGSKYYDEEGLIEFFIHRSMVRALDAMDANFPPAVVKVQLLTVLRHIRAYGRLKKWAEIDDEN